MDPIDLGHGCSYSFWRRSQDPEAHRRGLIWFHRKPDGSECVGSTCFKGQHVPGEPGGAEWDVVSWEPLTISPSLLCLDCGAHGFIRDGKWVPA